MICSKKITAEQLLNPEKEMAAQKCGGLNLKPQIGMNREEPLHGDTQLGC